MKEERVGKNHRFEEIINFCNEYEQNIEKVDFDSAQNQSQTMFHQFQQFGAISFYSQGRENSKSSPANTLQHKR